MLYCTSFVYFSLKLTGCSHFCNLMLRNCTCYWYLASSVFDLIYLEHSPVMMALKMAF